MAQAQRGIGWTAQLQVFSGWKGVEKASAMFLAGLGVMLVSTVSFSVWQWLKDAWRIGTGSFVTRMELNSRDESYVWVMEWIHAQKWAQECRTLSVSSTWETDSDASDGHSRAVVLYTPDVGNYVFRYAGVKIWIKRTRDENNASDQMARFGGVFETLTLTCWGHSRKLLQQLIDECMHAYLQREEGKTIIYTANHGSWQRFGSPRLVRPLSSVILTQGLSERLVADAHEFLGSAQWYADRGIPYRRGYLLYGPPGTGKTSFVTALAGHLGMSICVVNLNDPDLSDGSLLHLFNATPGKRCIILIEDIDAAPSSISRSSGSGQGDQNLHGDSSTSDASESDHASSSHSQHLAYTNQIMATTRVNNNITLSGLLNAIDGVASQEGRLLFMTTNHHERLDAALSRPGRIDVKVMLGYADKEQLCRLFLNFYPSHLLLASKFAEAIPDHIKLSSAHVQAHFMLYKSDPEAALKNVQQLITSVSKQASS